MFLEAAVLGLLVGWARKGKLSRLGKLPLKSLFLVLLAFLIQLLLMVDYRYGGYLSPSPPTCTLSPTFPCWPLFS